MEHRSELAEFPPASSLIFLPAKLDPADLPQDKTIQ